MTEQIKKILLIQPPYTIHKAEPKGCQPPLGLAYIAAVLEQNGFDVKILDSIVEGFGIEVDESKENDLIRYGLEFDDIEKIISGYAPDIVGISCLFSTQHNNAITVAKLVKNVLENCVVIMGGAHPSVAYRTVLESDFVDFVIIGEGEFSAVKLIDSLKEGKDLSNIDGLAYKENGDLKVNPKTKFIHSLDEIPFPARHLLPMDKYFRINRPHGTASRFTPNTSIITSRGCPANCIFCSIHSVWGKPFRARSPQNVIDEMFQLKEKYGIKELQFEDDNLTFDKKRAKQIFEMMYRENLDIAWTTPNGIAAYAIDDELVSLIKKSGGYRVCLAVESGDEYVLHKIIKKPLKLEKIKPLVSKFKQAGVAVDGFFVVGFPGETKEQMKRTFKFASTVGFDNVNFFIATPYPGTELYETCKESNFLPNDFSYARLKVGNANISTSEFSAKELESLVARESFKFRLNQLKNPIIFYHRVIKRLFIDPRFFISYLKRLLLRIFVRNE